MRYADYDYYKDIYGGVEVKDATTFNTKAREASGYIANRTFNKAKPDYMDSNGEYVVKDTMCEIVDKLATVFNDANSDVGVIVQETVSTWKREYRVGDKVTKSTLINDLIYMRLVNTGLLCPW